MRNGGQQVGRQGFTIIEVILFLSISALLAIAILGSWTLTLNTQSYKDSAQSLTAYLQNQLSRVNNVANERTDRFTCRQANGMTIVEDAATSLPRGTSNCVILGRYIFIDNKDLRSLPIIGYEAPDQQTSDMTEREVLLAYTPAAVEVDGLSSEDKIAWDARLYRPGAPNGTVREAIAMLRSPVTGSVQTYHVTVAAGANVPPTVRSLLTNTNASGALTLCLDAGAPVLSEKLAVVLGANTASQSSIVVEGSQEVTRC